MLPYTVALPDRDEVLEVIEAEFKQQVVELDEWRPLAQYIVDLVRMYVEAAEEDSYASFTD